LFVFFVFEKMILFTIANPTSARLSAGPSLVPSPVTATTSRCCVAQLSTIPLTKLYLSWGDERANTRNFGQTSSSFRCEI